MPSKQTTLIISNQTKWDIVKIKTVIENTGHWDGDDHPDKNFSTEKDSTVTIPKGSSLSKREELNSGVFSTDDGTFIMTLYFSNGENITFKNNQKDALTGYSRNNYWLTDDSSKDFSLFQSSGSGVNKFEIRRQRKTGNDAWMSEINDDTPVTKLSIPGSHDACCYHGAVMDWVQTQVADISTQLHLGIRYFDLRGYADGKAAKYGINVGAFTNFDGERDCQVCHDAFRQPETFKGFFGTIIDFLKTHDKETVLVQVKKDNGDKNLEDIVANIISDLGKENFYDGKDIPLLKNARKKIILVSREGSKWGFDIHEWKDEAADYAIQDDYNPETDLTESRVTNKFQAARDFHKKNAYGKSRLNLNFLSLAPSGKLGWWTPLNYAKGVNTEFLNFLRNQPGGYNSVFLMDGINDTDAAKDLVNLVINNNF